MAKYRITHTRDFDYEWIDVIRNSDGAMVYNARSVEDAERWIALNEGLGAND